MEKIFIARKRVKNLNIRITRDGQVHVTAPLRMSDADIESILDRKRGWIEKHRGQMLEKARLRPQNFESGETLRVLGKPFRLRVEEGGTPGVAISVGEVVLTMRPGSSREQREAALEKILPIQQKDFENLYEAMEGRPITIRFLDPPLHEFVPHVDMKEEIDELAKNLGITSEEVIHKINALHESNPMMGHRGCRLAVTYPEIAEMQTRAVLQAAIDVTRECGYNIVPEIMIPLVGSKKELAFVKSIVDETAKKVFEEQGMTLEYHVGTMIEIPRAAVTADEIAEEAEFFSFGTNDLTQMTFGFSRDDAGKFLGAYYDNKIFESDPFARLDTDGVGKLVQMAAKLGRQTRPNLKLGICGEHGGDPSSVMFCHKVGLNYVSCSPFRVPIAILAAAQANIRNPRK